ncbi:MAG: hypothetical protein Q8P18_09665 [Pseudomonadota bacterium]|nr:hypothetical protein [Pseudomonadota bacterium]
MNATLFFDSLLTALLSVALIGGGGLTLWLLPWSDADRAGTVRGLSSVGRFAMKLGGGEVVGRARAPFLLGRARAAAAR